MRLCFSGLFEKHLRQDQVLGRRCIPHQSFHLLPVFRLGSELVAGDNSPLGQVCACFGQINLRNLDTNIVVSFSFFLLIQQM